MPLRTAPGDLLQGTHAIRTRTSLLTRRADGHAIARRIEQTTVNVLEMAVRLRCTIPVTRVRRTVPAGR